MTHFIWRSNKRNTKRRTRNDVAPISRGCTARARCELCSGRRSHHRTAWMGRRATVTLCILLPVLKQTIPVPVILDKCTDRHPPAGLRPAGICRSVCKKRGSLKILAPCGTHASLKKLLINMGVGPHVHGPQFHLRIRLSLTMVLSPSTQMGPPMSQQWPRL